MGGGEPRIIIVKELVKKEGEYFYTYHDRLMEIESATYYETDKVDVSDHKRIDIPNLPPVYYIEYTEISKEPTEACFVSLLVKEEKTGEMFYKEFPPSDLKQFGAEPTELTEHNLANLKSQYNLDDTKRIQIPGQSVYCYYDKFITM